MLREGVDCRCGSGTADQGEMEVSPPLSSVQLPDEGFSTQSTHLIEESRINHLKVRSTGDHCVLSKTLHLSRQCPRGRF